MGAGILPATIYKGKLYFLFGKENKYEDSAPGFSDFGGGTDNNENLLETAAREATEELTGFLGDETDILKMLNKYGTYNINFKNTGHDLYRMHIFPIQYNEFLPLYFNNNHHFILKKLKPCIFKREKIFEKEMIKWISIDDIPKMRGEFRNYFENIIDILLAEKKEIHAFIRKCQTKKNKTTNCRKREKKNKTIRKRRK
jgi:8-oxo-dGTP pyrophosphatase MutT (NUDIX family)